jgi:hypothetical protein
MLGIKKLAAPAAPPPDYLLYSMFDAAQRARARADVAALCGELLAGLDPSDELEHLMARSLGDGLLLFRGGRLVRRSPCSFTAS